jgi:long-chain acyl-CoA synthetase
MAPLATGLRHEERLLDGDRTRSCGQAVAGVDVRVFDVSGKEVPPGVEVVVRGPDVMPGYWNKPEAPPSFATGGTTAATSAS